MKKEHLDKEAGRALINKLTTPKRTKSVSQHIADRSKQRIVNPNKASLKQLGKRKL